MAEYQSRAEGILDNGVVDSMVNVLGVNQKVPQSSIEAQLIDGGGGGGGGDEYQALFRSLINGSILGDIRDDEVDIIASYTFYERSNIQSVSFPKVHSIGSYAFYDCSGLVSVDFSLLSEIEEYAFYYCTNLKSVILRKQDVCRLSNINAFQRTPIRSGTGKVYVPANLVDQYKAASSWTIIASNIEAIPE